MKERVEEVEKISLIGPVYAATIILNKKILSFLKRAYLNH